jgi:hypothetical protein
MSWQLSGTSRIKRSIHRPISFTKEIDYFMEKYDWHFITKK